VGAKHKNVTKISNVGQEMLQLHAVSIPKRYAHSGNHSASSKYHEGGDEWHVQCLQFGNQSEASNSTRIIKFTGIVDRAGGGGSGT